MQLTAVARGSGYRTPLKSCAALKLLFTILLR